jgi:hypothetical protein
MELGTQGWALRKVAKALKTKLTQGGPSGSSLLRSDVLVMARQEAGPYETLPKMLKGELENNSRKPRDLQ